MRDYMRVTTEPVINKYQRNPPMDNAGDCGVYVIEYARVILQVSNYKYSAFFQTIPGNCKKYSR